MSFKNKKEQLKELENERNEFYREKISGPVQSFKDTVLQAHGEQIQEYDRQIYELTKLVRIEKKNKEKIKEEKFDPRLLKWFKKYNAGISYGNKEPRISYVDPSNYFVIVSAPGGTAGQGTSMGTGGYYYAPAIHFVAFPQYGTWQGRIRVKDASSDYYSNHLFEKEGKLTKEVIQQLISETKEFIKENDIQAYDLDEIAKFK